MNEERLKADYALTTMMREAMESSHRRLIVTYGENSAEVLAHIVWRHFMLMGCKAHKVIYVDQYDKGGAELDYFLEKLKKISYPIENVKHYAYEESIRLLGTTNDILILDMTEGARANDIGRLVETVKGGGLVILHNLNPNIETPWRTTIHKKLVSPPYDWSDLKPRFEKYFIRKVMENPNVWIFDGWKIIKGELLHSKKVGREKPVLPEKSRIPKRLHRLALTQDQARVLQILEEAMRGKDRSILVITANRGRGKSALLGLGAALLLHMGARRILVTAPGKEEVQVVFEMAERGLTTLGEKVKKEIESGWILRLKCKKGIIGFTLPYRALSENADVILVDEAAGIHIPLLFRLMKKFSKAVFASTIHGYEGAGRGFSVRFLKTLEEDKEVRLCKAELKEPIRYAPGDPVEEWLYDALLLDAEPPEIKETVNVEECRFEKPNLDLWFERDDRRLRQFIGIYVLAHYRNRPDDLIILGDAPHHLARALTTKNGEIIVALHLAEESHMPEKLIEDTLLGKPPSGYLIPACMVRYYPSFREFADMKGIRVVRIATHPELMDKGLGSLALKRLCEEAVNEGFDWVGASFGAEKRLLNFWLKNEFVPLHISPMRNVISGEFSVIVVKPLSEKAERIVREIHREFKLRLLESLPDTYYNLDPEVAAQLLSVERWSHLEKPELTPSQRERLIEYIRGSLAYESACDVVKHILRAHFLSSGEARLKLEMKDEAKLIARCLQCRSWDKTAEILETRPASLKSEIRFHIRRLAEHYEG